MKNIVPLIYLVILLSAIPTSAEMYKWVDENGKVHFTNTVPPAEVDANQVSTSHESVSEPRTESNEMLLDQGNQSLPREQKKSITNYSTNTFRGASQKESPDPRCAEILDEMKNLDEKAGSMTFGELLTYKQRKSALTNEYELRCMSSSAREERQDAREIKNLGRKLDQIQQKQQEIQNTQRGVGY